MLRVTQLSGFSRPETGGAGPTPGFSSWNPADKDATITLSNFDLSASFSFAGPRSLKAVGAKATGKWYWEILIDSSTSGSEIFGVANSSAPNSGDGSGLGQDTNGWGWRQNAQLRYGGVIGSYGAGFSGGDVIGVAVDLDAGKMWFSVNGVWAGSGDPETAANPAFATLTGSLMPSASGATANIHVANFGGSAFAYTVPTGFTAGWT
jgi:hypothetical protein